MNPAVEQATCWQTSVVHPQPRVATCSVKRHSIAVEWTWQLRLHPRIRRICSRPFHHHPHSKNQRVCPLRLVKNHPADLYPVRRDDLKYARPTWIDQYRCERRMWWRRTWICPKRRTTSDPETASGEASAVFKILCVPGVSGTVIGVGSSRWRRKDRRAYRLKICQTGVEDLSELQHRSGSVQPLSSMLCW